MFGKIKRTFLAGSGERESTSLAGSSDSEVSVEDSEDSSRVGLELVNPETDWRDLVNLLEVSQQFQAYHVWLDCLYDLNINIQTILDELSPIFNTDSRKKLLVRHRVFVIGRKLKDGTTKPAGSAFIILSDKISKQSDGDFEIELLDKRIRMLMVSFREMREQLNDNQIFMLSAASGTPIKTNENQQSVHGIVNNNFQPKSRSQVRVGISNIKSENMTSLTLIESKSRADEILSQFNPADYMAIGFLCAGNDKINPRIFKHLIPECNITWKEIFVVSRSADSISGCATVRKEHESYLKQLLRDNDGKFSIEEVKFEMLIMSWQDFLTIMAEYKNIYEFVVGKVAVPRTARTMRENPTTNVPPTSKPTNNNFNKENKQKQPKARAASMNRQSKLCPPSAQEKKNTFGANASKQAMNGPNQLDVMQLCTKYSNFNPGKLRFLLESLPPLLSFGNVAVEIQNLPVTLKIKALSHMVGSKRLDSKQVVAAVFSSNAFGVDLELMHVMLVMRPGDPDLQNILDKKHPAYVLTINVKVKLTNAEELAKFLAKNQDRIRPVKI